MTTGMNIRGRDNRTASPWPGRLTILALSHLRWDFVYQRPQHLLSRAARRHRVVYVEEPKRDAPVPFMEVRDDASGVTIAVPHLSASSTVDDLRRLLGQLLARENSRNLVLWYYTPLALAFTDHLSPSAVVYDCMDELSAFAGAPPELAGAERRLLARADLVLTGGHSLYTAKQRLHHNVHEFPSGVDLEHFAAAQRIHDDPADQARIPQPRIGFFGVLDERLDRQLLASIADQAPGWAFVLIGPVAKINRSDLPRRPNLHYLGPKPYGELPRYIAGWDVAMMPFAINAATRYISPTKTPEYLAAGKPVVSTPIADVVRTYGDIALAHIADTPELFVEKIRDALCESTQRRLARSQPLLSTQSWDGIWNRISERLRAALIEKHVRSEEAANMDAPLIETIKGGEMTLIDPGHDEDAELLQQTLDEEKAADKKLSGLAEGGTNQSAADAAEPEDEDDDDDDDEDEEEEDEAEEDEEEETRPVGRGARDGAICRGADETLCPDQEEA
jgi:glycosyltransferase involved in cell wall biosynthesis